MSQPYHSNDPDFEDFETEEEYLAWLNREDILICKCPGDYCVC